MIDPYHLETYGVTTVNYNRDVDIFPVLRAIMEEILGNTPYHSPTDMGVNMAGHCIYDDDACVHAAKMEILRRYFRTACEEKKNGGDGKRTRKLELLMEKAGVSEELCPAIAASRTKSEISGTPAGAMLLRDGVVVTAKTSRFFRAPAALLLNALKHLAGIDDDKRILSPEALRPICDMKLKYLGRRNPRLHADEVLIALSMASATNDDAKKALDCLGMLSATQAHFTVIPSEVDERLYKKLGINLTCEPKYEKRKLYHQ
jgi:uncharacterized protein (UPF0371 family)